MILLDTHVVVWLADDTRKLSKNAAAAIVRARRNEAGLAISALTLYELANLIVRKRIETNLAIELFLQDVESRFVVIPLSGAIAAQAAQFPDTYPKDPIDRIIGATARSEGLPLVTADLHIQESKAIRTIW
jgi:PIN domain nuclease of toxin-antitoxin system